MKKILLFTDSLGAGGAQRQIVGLAIFLHKAGYEVKVSTYFNIDFYKNTLDENDVCNELIPGADKKQNRILAVCSYLKREKPDWVIAYQETPSLVTCAAKLLGGKFRLIVSERNTTQHIGANERVRFFLYRWADAIVPNSYAQEAFLSSNYPWMNKKLTAISNFVDLKYFNFEEKKRSEVPEIAVAASIWASKNTLGFIDAVKIIAAKGLRFHISWYGKSESNIEYYNKCLRKIEEYGIQNYISLENKTKQIKFVYQNADFLCLPSFHEGTPNVICEAMSCGRPIICSSVCDNPIYVAEGENGFLFNPAEAFSMADAIERALNVKDMNYAVLCLNSRKKAERLFSEKVFVNKYIKIIEGK